MHCMVVALSPLRRAPDDSPWREPGELVTFSYVSPRRGRKKKSLRSLPYQNRIGNPYRALPYSNRAGANLGEMA